MKPVDLLAVALKVVDTIISSKGPIISVPQDWYRNIRPLYASNSSEEPSAGIGSLSDDLKEVHAGMADRYLITFATLERLVGILIAIGDELTGVAFYNENNTNFVINFDLRELRDILQKVFNELFYCTTDEEDLGYKNDFKYWSIEPKLRFNFEESVSVRRFIKGSFNEDIALLKEIRLGKRQPTFGDLITLGHVLQVLGDY